MEMCTVIVLIDYSSVQKGHALYIKTEYKSNRIKG